ncbi:hypothetical protein [Vibrio anguillarum]|uniref:Uncharacterized protein n=2 Tax=Vibrio anguillarum TaxID=55601 RepID=A0A7U6J4P7_VIBAN|nr:hypothetical protein [Vibrio anguillarum]AZS26314.1 hypothetical protein DYL72_15510 [Vibrio anguillarum]MBF4374459.1 hypothetical protein [Vibrio anguillarum]MBF4382089.1 hypothetical protein [Vibrio anguillarum]MBF4436610.1 hypothetical protein [Vibrio anguillarum]
MDYFSLNEASHRLKRARNELQLSVIALKATGGFIDIIEIMERQVVELDVAINDLDLKIKELDAIRHPDTEY